jgi:hypothetical protein
MGGRLGAGFINCYLVGGRREGLTVGRVLFGLIFDSFEGLSLR